MSVSASIDEKSSIRPSRPESGVTTAVHESSSEDVRHSREYGSHSATTVAKDDPPGAVRKGDVVILDWNGPEDLGNPRNWTTVKKWQATFIVSSFTFISPVSSSMIAPCSSLVATEFGITNSVTLATVTSIFVLAYAFGPLLFGPLSEIYGRSRVLQLANLFYLVWNLACGFAQNTTQLIIFRFLSGFGGSAPLSIGGGVVGDLFSPEQRGTAIAIYSLAPLLGPVVGPIAGAWIGQRSTWRWVFWSTTIVDAAIQVVGIFYLRETYAPFLLEKRAKHMQKSGDIEKNTEVRTIFDEQMNRNWKTVMKTSLVRPFVLFFYEPIIQLLGAYMAFVYGLMYLFITTIPGIFEGIYQEKVGIAGLNYLAFGVGLTGASQVNARLLDYIYRKLKERNGGIGKPEFRLPPMFPGTIVLPIGLFLAGWTANKNIHWIVPDIGIAFVGAGVILNFQVIQTYVIDAFTLHAASALASVTFLRSLCGFGFPLFAPAMYSALGYGKGNSILAVIGILIGCPAPFLFWRYGERIRNSSKFAH